jgi:hypothetical protein
MGESTSPLPRPYAGIGGRRSMRGAANLIGRVLMETKVSR